MAPTATDYSRFVDKKVTFVRNEAGKTEAEQCEGTLVAANGDLLMFKPKGKTQATLIPASEVENMDFAPETAKKISRKRLKVVEFGQARAHLLERHGVTLEWVNGASEKDAFDYHAGLDHVQADLGHYHGDKDDKAAEGKSDEAGDES